MLEKLCAVANMRPSLRAMNSAHPILRPFLFHPALSRQDSQTPLKTIPMPQEVEASTQKPKSCGGGGCDKDVPQTTLDNSRLHHDMSLKTLEFGSFRTKEDEQVLNEAVKRERAGKCDLPLGKTREQWTSVPRIDSASFRVNLLP